MPDENRDAITTVGRITFGPGGGYRPAEEADAAFRAWRDEHRRPQELPVGTEPAWVVIYDDPDMPDEIFMGAGAEVAARRRFNEQRGAWSLSLFQEVARA